MAGQTYLSQFILLGSIDIAIILAGYSFSENWKLYGWPPRTNLSDEDRLNSYLILLYKVNRRVSKILLWLT